MAISLTEAAAAQICRNIDKRGGGLGVRLAVKPSGCSGFMYSMDFVDELKEGDEVVERDGAKLVIGIESLPFIDGTEVGFERQGLNQTFVFNNPNAVSTCGCGESFSIEK
ncbi:MAG: iron-sulfur cluster assembly accessory protein [Gammaproteobacteria bacterium]|nr:iron-sulfur cluster assembly accessory protein [Gammaproteobacteria bacterium]MCP5135483.1 iron-sulfur cluster assembly accessory protein [Gammaproteobacteria bacterium]